MSDFSDEDELPDISFTVPSKYTLGKSFLNNLKQDQKILTSKTKQELTIPTDLESALKDITDGLKEITDGSLKVNDFSPQLSSPSFQLKKKWKRHSLPNAKDNSPSNESYMSDMMPDISLTHTPPSSKKPPVPLRHSPSSPITSWEKTLGIGGSPNQAYIKERPHKQNDFKLDDSGSSSRNATNRSEIVSNVSPLSKRKKIDQIPVNHQNIFFSLNHNSGTIQSEDSISKENKSTPTTRKIDFGTENMNTPPSRKKKFGIESSPGSDLLERCLKKLGYDDEDKDLGKKNQKDVNKDCNKKLHGVNDNDTSKPGSLSDINNHLSFEMDNENIENELNIRKIETPTALLDVANKKSNIDSVLTKKDNLHQKINGKSWIGDYKMESGVFHNETMLSIISETTKKCRCNCRRGDCSRKQCSCKRSGGTCGSHCGCQLSICKNRATDIKVSPSSRKALVPSFSNPTLNLTRIKTSPDNMIKKSVQIASSNRETSPSGVKQIVNNPPKLNWLKSFRVIGNPVNAIKTTKEKKSICSETPIPADKIEYCNNSNNQMLKKLRIIKNPVKAINMLQNDIPIKSSSKSEILSSADETNVFYSSCSNQPSFIRTEHNIIKNPVDNNMVISGEILNQSILNYKNISASDGNAIHNSSNLLLKSLYIHPCKSPLKYLLSQPSTSKNDATIYDFGSIEVPQSNKVVIAEISNESTSTSGLKSLCIQPSTSTNDVTIFKSRIKLLQGDSLNVPMSSELVGTNSLSDSHLRRDNESSTFGNESISVDKDNNSVDDRGNQVLLIPESLTFLRNSCESSVTNPDNQSKIANSSNHSSIDTQTGTMQESSTSKPEAISSLSNSEVIETNLNSYADTFLDETGMFQDNLLEETISYNSNLLDETVPYNSNLLDQTVPYTGNLNKRTESKSNKNILKASTPLKQVGPTSKKAEEKNQAERISKQRPSADDLGYASDTQPSIKRIRIGPILNENIKKEVDSGKSWDQIKQERSDTETPGCSKDSWHRPHTTTNSLQVSNAAQVKQEPSSPIFIKKEDEEILPGTLVKVLLRKSNMRETKANLLNEFHPAPLNKVINENPQLFKVQLCMVADCLVILAPINISLCGGHSGPDGCKSRATCAALHICTNFVSSKCLDELCVYGHSFYTNHNKAILKILHLENVDTALLCKLLKSVVKIAEPKHLIDICRFYNRSGCNNHTCNNLHVCLSFVIGKCKCSNVNCSLNHNILNDKCRDLLSKAGIDTNETPRDVMVALLALNSSISETILELE